MSSITARRRIVQAISIISNCMKSSHLKLNPSKTQFIPFSRKTNPSSFSPLQLDDQVYVSPVTEVRNLGVLMDSKLNFHSHVSEMRRNCFHQLKRLNSIRSFVPQDQFAIFIHAFITRRIDFCISIFYSLPKNLVSRVQTIQNSCAKCLTRLNRFSSATDARITLHWLPTRARSKFKILLFAHKAVHQPNSGPHYISAPFSTTGHGRTTRFNMSNTLKCDF